MKNPVLNDVHLRVAILSLTPEPGRVVYAAMHQDYSENFVYDDQKLFNTSSAELEKKVVKHLLAGERGHYGPLEHAQITFNVGWFPHSVMQQARTHRVGISFDVQSMRYTGRRICDFADRYQNLDAFDLLNNPVAVDELEELFFLRPVGKYSDRQGKKYDYTIEMRDADMILCYDKAHEYAHRVNVLGYAEEHARSILPFDFRQHFVVSFTLRSLLHFLDLRSKLDAQLEIQAMCELMWPHVKAWVPHIAEWYETTRLHKARLAP